MIETIQNKIAFLETKILTLIILQHHLINSTNDVKNMKQNDATKIGTGT